jgi:hypothetical protein
MPTDASASLKTNERRCTCILDCNSLHDACLTCQEDYAIWSASIEEEQAREAAMYLSPEQQAALLSLFDGAFAA